jgi:hypothetical protein
MASQPDYALTKVYGAPGQKQDEQEEGRSGSSGLSHTCTQTGAEIIFRGARAPPFN